MADAAGKADGIAEVRRQEALLKTGALQNAILTSANFSIIATDEKGIIQLFNVGAERMLGYVAAEVVNRISPSDMHDRQEVMARAEALSVELATTIAPGFRRIELQGLARDRGHLRTDVHPQGWQPVSGHRVDHGAARRLWRHHRLSADRHRQFGAQAGRIGVARRHGRCGKGQPRKIGFSFRHEPRAAHAAQRDPRLCAAHGIRFAAADRLAEAKHRSDPPCRMVPAGTHQRNPRSRADRVREAIAIARAELTPRSHARMPGDDRTAGAKARHQRRVSAVRIPDLRQSGPNTGEAGSHQPAFQRDQIQQEQAGRSSWTAARAPRDAFGSASPTPARD